jgi:hypothetical protein
MPHSSPQFAAANAVMVTLMLALLFSGSLHAQSILPESPVSSSLSNSSVGSGEIAYISLNPAQTLADSLHPIRAAIVFAPYIGGLKDANKSDAESN